MKISRRKLLTALGLGILIPTTPQTSTGKYDKYLKFREPVGITLDVPPSPNVDDLVEFTDYDGNNHYGRVVKLHSSYIKSLRSHHKINGVQNRVIHKIHIVERGTDFPWCMPVEMVRVTAKAVYNDAKQLIGWEGIPKKKTWTTADGREYITYSCGSIKIVQ